MPRTLVPTTGRSTKTKFHFLAYDSSHDNCSDLKTFLFINLFLLLIIGCKNISERNGTTDPLKIKIMGNWGGLGEKPSWNITSDSIFYYNSGWAYPYVLKGDTFMVKFSDRDTFSKLGIIKVIEDTLRIVQYNRNNFIISAYRTKE